MPGTIKAHDFSQRTTDPDRDRWTFEKLKAVAKAMEGKPALVELDRRTVIKISQVREDAEGAPFPVAVALVNLADLFAWTTGSEHGF